MLAHRTGGRYDGRDWPLPGEILDTTDAEANHLIGAGDAVEVTGAAAAPEPEVSEPEAEVTEPEPVPAPPAPPGPPRVNAPRADWAAYAIDYRGANPSLVDEMTKAALIEQYGKGAG